MEKVRINGQAKKNQRNTAINGKSTHKWKKVRINGQARKKSEKYMHKWKKVRINGQAKEIKKNTAICGKSTRKWSPFNGQA